MDSFYNCWFSVDAALSVLQRANYNAKVFLPPLQEALLLVPTPKNEADPEIPKRLPSIVARAQPRSIDGSTVSSG